MTLCDDTSPRPDWPFVRTLLEHDVVDSTSDVAAELVRTGAVALPLAVSAHRQTRGRGRGDHKWWSDTGSLTFTLAIDPAAHGLVQIVEPSVALAAAVAVIDALGELGFGEPGLGIRWPNDVECGGRKLGGILPESLTLDAGRRLLIGVGLNVRTNFEQAPDGLRSLATSLADRSSRSLQNEVVPQLLAAILRRFESTLTRLVAQDPELTARWNALDLLRDRPVLVDLGTHQIQGRAVGIDALGALCVDDGRTTVRVFGGSVIR